MTSDLDIWRAANLLIKRHGERDAAIVAAQRADECLASGDVVGAGGDDRVRWQSGHVVASGSLGRYTRSQACFGRAFSGGRRRPIMTQISGMELESFGGGGAVNEGRAIWAKMRLFDGQEHGEMVILLDHERFPFELLARLDYVAIAREERLKRDPGGEAAGRVTGSVAFPISDVLDGAPINYPGITWSSCR